MDLSSLGIKAVHEFDGIHQSPLPQERLKAARKQASAFRERLMSEPPVQFYQSADMVRVPYPTWYAYSGVYTQSTYKFPYIHILNRIFIIQYHDFLGELKTLLFSPSDIEADRETPFFKRLTDKMPNWSPLENVVAPVIRDVAGALAEVGLMPEDVDYISYDHLHTQDIRRWLGTKGSKKDQAAYFPNAKILVHEREWQSASALLPVQADWYCPNGIDGIDPDKVIRFTGSIQLGEGLALVHTPGHTEGNHSLVARVPDGIRVTSENGVGADAYAPMYSTVDAIRRYAKETGMEVILNGNTLEGSNEQYISMVIEKTIAGPSQNPDFPNCASSSEATPYWLIPGHKVSHLIGEATFGTLQAGSMKHNAAQKAGA
ncbi:hypothetical protein CAP50_10940 [Psychrobacter sp. L7]|uniref:hypothetical protein n=1 Tax=Psychrobacter sp. L7 TaxID=1982756 RepID=UPI000C299D86|nr:hypothetical protein [Psychrobacter sp. L7]PJX21388.1 hypothetical protein CAP50_10940 [Psychrobacter sp. L7]